MKHAKKSPTPTPPQSDSHASAWITGSVLALFVARPLVAGDGGAQEGGGVMLVMLWVVLACALLGSMALRPRFAIRFGLVDASVCGLVLWQVVSGCQAFRVGSPRPAINMLWEWVALGLAFLLVRQTADTGPRRRLAVALMVSLAVAISAVGFYQTFVTLPQARARYESIKDDPQAMLQTAHQWYPAGSAARQRFEDRLESVEPTATFTLTNSLAGFLTPWLVVVLGIAALNRNLLLGQGRSWLLAAMAIGIAGCLVWTKSRTSYVAAAVGTALLLPVWKSRRAADSLDSASDAPHSATIGATRVGLGIAAIAGLLFVVAAGLGGIDKKVFSEAGKSLGYRVQYWQATLPIVAEAPLLGCGPGQFQAAYTQFKLPDASEEVRDPHNLLLEVAATAGVPALLFLIVVLAAFAWLVVRKRPHAAAARAPTAEPPLSRGLIWGSAAGGVAVALLASFTAGLPLEIDSLAIVLVCLFGCVAVLLPWIERGMLSPGILAAGVAALVVNLLAAGGITYPGVAGSLWLLIALALNEVEVAEPEPATWSRRWAQLAILPASVLGVACYFTAYQPVLQSKSQLSGFYAGAGQDSPEDQLLLAENAVRADPYSIEAATLLAHEYLERWKATRDADMLDDFRMGSRWLVQIAPKSSMAWAQTGRWFNTIYRLSPQQEQLFSALADEAFKRAVELYPNNPVLHAELAQVLETRKQPTEARREAADALRLDELMREAGHRDKRLSDELRTAAERIASGTANSGGEGTDKKPARSEEDAD